MVPGTLNHKPGDGESEMQVRQLVVGLIAGLNSLVDELEKVLGEDGEPGEEDLKEDKPRRRSRAAKEDPPEDKPRRSRARKDDDDDDADKDDAEDDDDDKGGDEPSEDDIIDAVKAAQKICDKDDIAAIIRKYGKCDRASQVPDDRRAAVIKALDKLVDEAK